MKAPDRCCAERPPIRAFCKPERLLEKPIENHLGGKSGHNQIDAAKTQRGQPKEQADNRRNHSSQKDGDQQWHTQVDHKPGGRKSSKPHKGRMRYRYEARIAVKEVQRQSGKGKNGDGGKKGYMIARQKLRKEYQNKNERCRAVAIESGF